MIIKNGSDSILLFDGEKIKCHSRATPEIMASLGTAVAQSGGKCSVVVMCCSHRLSPYRLAFISGLMSGGAAVCDCKNGFRGLLEFAVKNTGADIGVMLWGDKNITVELCDKNGRSIDSKLYNKIRRTFSSPVYPGKQSVFVSSYGHLEQEYTKSIIDNLSGLRIHIECVNRHFKTLLADIFSRCGAQIYPYETLGCMTLCFDRYLRTLTLRDEKMGEIADDEVNTLVLAAMIMLGRKNVAYSSDMPTYFDRMCSEHGVKYQKVYDCGADDAQARKLSAADSSLFDCVRGAVTLCAALAQKDIRLQTLRKTLPREVRKVRNIWIPASRKEYVLYKLARKNGMDEGMGVEIDHDGASVMISPCLTGGMRLAVEAASEETAEELCSFYKREIYRLAESAEDKV